MNDQDAKTRLDCFLSAGPFKSCTYPLPPPKKKINKNQHNWNFNSKSLPIYDIELITVEGFLHYQPRFGEELMYRNDKLLEHTVPSN